MSRPAPRRSTWGAGLLALGLAALLALAACGASPTPTPSPVPSPTPAPTSTPVPTRAAAQGSPSPGASPAANPAAVTAAFANLQRLDSYHLEITASGFDKLLPTVGLAGTLTITTDYNKGNQHTIVSDSSGARQEAYKVGDKVYLVDNGQVTEATNLPLLFSLPDLLYLNLTQPGATTFTQVGNEQANGRATTKYTGTGSLTRLAANPLLASALAGAAGDINAAVWVDRDGGFLVAGDITVNVTAPSAGTAKMRLDTTKVGEVGPIQPPR
jgi:hypothetical protein